MEIVVGPSQTIWRLHENLLSATSDFFRAAFNSGFKESLEDRLLLPEDDPHAFELFVRWLYARALQGMTGSPDINAERLLFGSSSTSSTGTNNSNNTGSSSTGFSFTAGSNTGSTGPSFNFGSTHSAGNTGPNFTFGPTHSSGNTSGSFSFGSAPTTITNAPSINIQDCLRLYALATKLLVEDLENSCVDVAARYYKVGTRRPEIRDVQYIYENTPPESGMRRLLKERLTLVLFRGRQSNNKDKPVAPEWRDVLHETPEMGFDLLSEVASYNWVPGPNVPPIQRTPGQEGCTFHRHDKTDLCRPR